MNPSSRWNITSALPGISSQNLRALSWNCKGLLHHDQNRRSAKWNLLAKLLLSVDVACLQECHGTTEEQVNFLHFFATNFHMFASGHEDNRASGGVVTLLRKTSFNSLSITPLVHTEGRALCVIACDSVLRDTDFKSVTFWNVHNYGFNTLSSRALHKKINNSVRKSTNIILLILPT